MYHDDDLDGVFEQIIAADARLRHKTEEAKKLQTNLERKITEMVKLGQETASLRSMNTQLKKELTDARRTVGILKARNDDEEETDRDAKIQVGCLHAIIASKDATIKAQAEMESEINDLRDKVNTKKAEIRAKQHEIEQASSEVQGFVQQANEKWEELKTGMREVGVSNEAFGRRDREVEALRREVEALSNTMDEERRRKRPRLD